MAEAIKKLGREKEYFFNNEETTAKLRKEIDSWNAFIESLGAEDEELFKEMLLKSWSYSDSIVGSSDDEHTTESLLISLLVSQQKTIDRLSKEILTLSRLRQGRFSHRPRRSL